MTKPIIGFIAFSLLQLFTPMLSFSQSFPDSVEFNYKAAWEKVEAFEKEGLTRSALEMVDTIFTASARDTLLQQQVKALVYQMKYNSVMEENSEERNLERIQGLLVRAQSPMKEILQSYLATFYWNYYQSHRWEIIEGTDMAQSPEDFRTWPPSEYHRQIQSLFLASIENAEVLQNIPIQSLDILVRHEDSSQAYRPTLYDILAQRALDYLQQKDIDIAEPVNKFEWSQQSAFLDAIPFSQYTYTTEDSSSRLYQAIGIYQRLLAFHRKGNPNALVDWDLARLQFAMEQAIGEDKDSLYQAFLQRLVPLYRENDITAEVQAALAQWHMDQGNKYNPLSSDQYADDYKQAEDLCNKTLATYPNSRGAKLCEQILINLQAKDLQVEVEEANLPAKPFRAKLSFRNLTKVYCKIVPATIGLERNYEPSSILAQILAQKPVKDWELDLPDLDDRHRHSTEIKIPDLKPGYYALIVSDNPEFSSKGHAVTYAFTWVTQLSFFHRIDPSANAINVFVADRETGEPLQGVQLQAYIWNYDKRAYENFGGLLLSDGGGMVNLPVGSEYQQLEFDLRKENDRLRSANIYAYSNPAGEEKVITRTHFVTDRSIYRPGQTIYFKAIHLTQSERLHKVKKDAALTVALHDVNGLKVQELQLKTNEFGSATGSFTAPSSGLTGEMSLRSEDGSLTYVSVEEYKRPTFEIKFDPVQGGYALGDTISASGAALAYAGNVLEGVEVNYRVQRRARFPYWRGSYSWQPQPSSPAREIAFGTVKTDSTGKFSITFPLIPDSTLAKEEDPIYTFDIMVDVIDLTGETHSATLALRASSIPVEVRLDVAERVSKIYPGFLRVISENFSGAEEAVKGNMSLSLLKSPERTFRRRRWEQADTVTIDRKKYEKWFPHDAYKDENDPNAWEVEQVVFKRDFDVRGSREFPLDVLRNAAAGMYKAELSVLDGKIKITKFFVLDDPKSNTIAYTTALDAYINKTVMEPGETLIYTMATAESNAWVLFEVEKDGRIFQQERVQLTKNNKKEIKVPVIEAFRGNFTVSLTWIQNNQYERKTHTVVVPWTNKELTLEWSSFRSELQPNDPDTWRLTVSGFNQDRVAAEMVATLYDASLDAFRPHSMNWDLYPTSYPILDWNGNNGFGVQYGRLLAEEWYKQASYVSPKMYSSLQGFGYFEQFYGLQSRRVAYMNAPVMAMSMRMEESDAGMPPPAPLPSNRSVEELQVLEKERSRGGDTQKGAEQQDEEGVSGLDQVDIRKNLKETAFFFPQLKTNASGEVVMEFTIPESLTRWRFLGLAHTEDLRVGTLAGSTVTRKKLMLRPAMPRFFRTGDSVTVSAKITNTTEKALDGRTEIRLLDPFTNEAISQIIPFGTSQRSFHAEPGQSIVVDWNLSIPQGPEAVLVQMVAKADNFSDGEEHVLPVLSDRMMVTESLPLAIRGKQSKTFVFDKLQASDSSTTLEHQKLTFEFSDNPAWYAVQALPFLMEFPYECTEQIFSRLYANAWSARLATQSPKIQAVFDKWKEGAGAEGTGQGLISNLDKNEELKSLLLSETPWVLNARSETERKQRIGLLFDANRMAGEINKAWTQLTERQQADGSFSWFPGMPSNRYITQLIVAGLGEMKGAGLMDNIGNPESNQLVEKALTYLDGAMLEAYTITLSTGQATDSYRPTALDIQYLYLRSMYGDIALASGSERAHNFYLSQSKKYWMEQSRYLQSMLALTFHRKGEKTSAETVVRSLKENAVMSPEMGMYWKSGSQGYYWQEAPIESQAMAIQAFHEVTGDIQSVEEMKLWLLKNKQTQDWETTRATVAACQALLSKGKDWLTIAKPVTVHIAKKPLDVKKRPDTKAEAGTGYMKTAWVKEEITPDMAQIQLDNPNDGVAWGAMYWQYMENIDRITKTTPSPLSVEKKLFIEKQSNSGPVLLPLTHLKRGDKVVVRLEIRADRSMEYVHIKDMRAAGFEPVAVLSQYKWKSGLGYYESTKDVSTHFFIDFLPQGTYVLEYPLRATLSGNFSGGITSIQCMYAPEFSSHTEGTKIQISKE